MVEIFPFRSIGYDLAMVGSLTEVTAPPYDVIEPPLQEALYDKHPANVVRLILNRKTPADSLTDNPYIRARQMFQQWLQTGVLACEDQPAMVAYAQTWPDPKTGDPITRKGVIALLKLNPETTAQVLPHEKTIHKYITDRLLLSKTVQANLSQLFMIYSDPQRWVEQQLFEADTPKGVWQEAVDHEGVIHRLCPVTDLSVLKELQARFASQTLLIADGHHRYQTALTVKEEARVQYKKQYGTVPKEGQLLTDYVMVFLSNIDDDGLVVYPTHRVLKSWPPGWNQSRFEAALFRHFSQVDAHAFEQHTDVLGYEAPGHGHRLFLKLKSTSSLKGLHPLLHPLDSAVLDHVVVETLFQSSAQNLKTKQILHFERDEAEVQRQLKHNEAVAAFYLHAPALHQVKAVCESGHLMPQKSTFFYPKILSGTVFYGYEAFPDAKGHALSGVVSDALPLPQNFWPVDTLTPEALTLS